MFGTRFDPEVDDSVRRLGSVFRSDGSMAIAA
jgi:hypothetical protein